MRSATCSRRSCATRRVRSSRLSVARSLLSERVRSRATKQRNWQAYAEVLAALGETERANAARQQAAASPEAGA